MNKIEFAKRCMTQWAVCSGIGCSRNCPYGISFTKGEIVCSDRSRKAWAEKVLKEAIYSTTPLYPPSTFTATPALAEPREEEDYEEEKELPRFESKTRGGYEYIIYKIYSEESGVLPYLIHGAVKNDEGKWKYSSWRLDGGFSDLKSVDATDLIPLKKRRMKTLNELGKDYDFHYADGLITVYGDGMKYKAVYSPCPEYNFDEMDEAWKAIFIIEEAV